MGSTHWDQSIGINGINQLLGSDQLRQLGDKGDQLRSRDTNGPIGTRTQKHSLACHVNVNWNGIQRMKGALALLFPLHSLILLVWLPLASPLDDNKAVFRDGTLESLAGLLNSHGPSLLNGSSSFSPEQHGEKFLSVLSKWLVAEPAVPFKPGTDHSYVPPGPLDCKDKDYTTVLTGKPLASPRFIVDFVAFGYDLDSMEIRLVETGASVDLFVVYESPRTQSGWVKPMIFREAMQHPRFRPFLPKILYFAASDEDISGFTHKTMHATHHGKGSVHLRKGAWALEQAQRTEIIRRFREVVAMNATLKALVEGGGQRRSWGLQNDEDELVNGDALKHLRRCEVRAEVTAIYTPCVSFKKSFHWLQLTSDLMCLGNVGEKENELAHYLWRPGPWLWPLEEMLRRGSTLRHVFPSKGDECQHHMGIPSAFHLSAVDDPAAAWFKHFGVIEESTAHVLSDSFVKAWGKAEVTPELIASTVRPWCNTEHPSRHVSVLSEAAYDALMHVVPTVVIANPDRYPFHLPANLSLSEATSHIRKFADPHWVQLCQT